MGQRVERSAWVASRVSGDGAGASSGGTDWSRNRRLSGGARSAKAPAAVHSLAYFFVGSGGQVRGRKQRGRVVRPPEGVRSPEFFGCAAGRLWREAAQTWELPPQRPRQVA